MFYFLGCLFVSLIFGTLAYGLCLEFVPNYAQLNHDFHQTLHGGLSSGLGFFALSLALSQKTLSEITFKEGLMGLLMVLIIGPLTPLFVMGSLALLSNLIGGEELWDLVFVETLGGFLSGSLSVGLVFGLILALSKEKNIW